MLCYWCLALPHLYIHMHVQSAETQPKRSVLPPPTPTPKHGDIWRHTTPCRLVSQDSRQISQYVPLSHICKIIATNTASIVWALSCERNITEQSEPATVGGGSIYPDPGFLSQSALQLAWMLGSSPAGHYVYYSLPPLCNKQTICVLLPLGTCPGLCVPGLLPVTTIWGIGW